jgi:hypothetical protein
MPGKQPRNRDGEDLIMSNEDYPVFRDRDYAPPAMPRAAQEYLSEKGPGGTPSPVVFGTGDPFVPFEAVPARPEELAPGTVLGFTKRYREDGPGYSFVALRVDRKGWYLSGLKHPGTPMDWDELLDFIGGPDDWARVGVVTAWTPLVVR